MNSVFCCFSWEKRTKCAQDPGLVNEFSATPRGHLNWTGPIANGSEMGLLQETRGALQTAIFACSSKPVMMLVVFHGGGPALFEMPIASL